MTQILYILLLILTVLSLYFIYTIWKYSELLIRPPENDSQKNKRLFEELIKLDETEDDNLKKYKSEKRYFVTGIIKHRKHGEMKYGVSYKDNKLEIVFSSDKLLHKNIGPYQKSKKLHLEKHELDIIVHQIKEGLNE